MSYPWLKFYPTDWRADPALRMCSLQARGLWIEMIALMHEAVPYGHLLISDKPPTDTQLAVLGGAPIDQVTNSLGELEAAGVFSRTRKGVIYSRRMVRDGQGRVTAMKNGKKGGNPTLRKLAEKMRPDNPTVNKGVNPQKPETRNQRDDDDDVREADTLRYRILKEVGADPVSGMTGPNGSLLGTRIDMDRVNAWQTDLGLNSDTIVAVIAETMSRKRDGPPNRFTYFDRAMQKEAGRRNEPRLAPIKETHNDRYSKAPEVRRAASADDAFAERISFAARNRSPSRTNCGFS